MQDRFALERTIDRRRMFEFEIVRSIGKDAGSIARFLGFANLAKKKEENKEKASNQHVGTDRIVSRSHTYLHMFAQRARMGIRLVAAGNSTIVRLVGRVDVTVLLAVAAVREPPLAARVFALERFLAWKKKTGN